MEINIRETVVEASDGSKKKLGDYSGKVLLIVNVASQCGNTPQYSELQELQSRAKAIVSNPESAVWDPKPTLQVEVLQEPIQYLGPHMIAMGPETIVPQLEARFRDPESKVRNSNLRARSGHLHVPETTISNTEKNVSSLQTTAPDTNSAF